jgi:transposase
MDNLVVGIDVAKAGLDVHLLPAGEAFAVGRDAAGIDGLIARLRPLVPAMVAVEATGGLESVVAAGLGAAGLPVVVVNPAQVRAFAQALGKRAKTDPIDAAVIARFAAATRPAIRPLADAETTALADTLARRRQIIQMIVAEGQREKRASKRMKKSIQRLKKALQKELTDIDREIPHGSRDTVRGSPIWSRNEDLLASVPGVGPAISRTLIAELPELGTLDRRRWQPWRVSHRSPANPASGAARPSSPPSALHGCDGRRQAQPDPQSLLRAPDRRRESRRWLPSSRSPESCSPSSTPSSGTKNRGNTLDDQDSRSPRIFRRTQLSRKLRVMERMKGRSR